MCMMDVYEESIPSSFRKRYAAEAVAAAELPDAKQGLVLRAIV